MTVEQQLEYVARYFLPYAGRLHTLSDVYMTILWPKAIGKPESYVLFDTNDRLTRLAYSQNRGFDANKDGKIIKAEAAARVAAMLTEGLRPENRG